MRLIGHLENEKRAFTLYSYLLSEGIHSTYEKEADGVSIWIYEEDEIERAQALLAEFKSNPSDPKYGKIEFPTAPPQPPDKIAEQQEPAKKKLSLPPGARKIRTYPITYFVIFVCVLLYFLNTREQYHMVKEDGVVAAQIGMTPIQQKLMFDYPARSQKINQLLNEQSFKEYKEIKEIPPSTLREVEQIPTWQGVLSLFLRSIGKLPPTAAVDGPLFTDILKGEVWRLITPIFLHGGFFHILFNMLWAWLLLRQVEERLSRFKLLFFILIVGVVSNVAQYLISGPYFLGFSGVVVGLVGFIWARQKLAPWEGYPLNRTTFIFVAIFVLGMFALEIISLLTAVIFAKELSANIANTAHIVGGLIGYLLGRATFFSRGPK